MSVIVDITGKKYKNLTVVCPAELSGSGDVKWLCVCKCGGVCGPTKWNLDRGATTSCGCLGYKNRVSAKTKHGHRRKKKNRGSTTTEKNKVKLYEAWVNMKRRCNDKTNKAYRLYGGRGIYVCKRWMCFKNFMNDMGPHPGNDLQLDRINNNGSYTPKNCKWSTRSEQQINRRPFKRHKTP